MRLTLRTLLAQKDGVLERSDAELLESKIRESSFATTLRQRMESCMRRRHLGAPPIEGRGLGGDANSVAEYLDNTLSQERIAEFERICLESDVQLAEITACHQVLTIVLEQPATITPTLRNRIQSLDKADSKGLATAGVDLRRRGEHYMRMDPSHQAKDQERSETAEHLRDEVRASKQPDTIRKHGIDLSDRELTSKVPEYLRGRSSKGWRQILLTVGLIALLILLSWQTIGSFDTLKNLWNHDVNAGAAQGRSTEAKSGENGKEANPDPRANPDPKRIGEKPSDPKQPNPISGKEETPNGGKEDASVNPVANVGEPTKAAKPNENGTSEGAVPVTVTPPPTTNTNPSTETGTDSSSIGAKWLPDTREAKESVVFWMRQEKPNVPQSGAYGESIPVGARIIVPPSFATEFRLDRGIRWGVSGATDMQILDRKGKKYPVIQLTRGRAILYGSEQGQQLELRLDEARSVLLEFASPTSIVGVEVRHAMLGVPWVDAYKAPSVLQVMALEGDASCTLSVNDKTEGAPVPVPFGKAFGWVEGNPPVSYAMQSVPNWIKNVSARPIEAIAARDLYAQLGGVKPEQTIELLKSLATNRRPETAAISIRTLFALGDYSVLNPETQVFGNVALKAHWGPMIDDLKASLATEESRAGELAKLWPSPMANLLAAFSDEQLANGGDRLLVDALESPNLAQRVLAIHSLRQILGTDLEIAPDRPNPEGMQALKKMLSTGKIRHTIPPVPLPEALIPSLPQ